MPETDNRTQKQDRGAHAITRLDVPRCTLGECPLWDHRVNRLLWVDSYQGTVWRLDPDTGELEQREVGEKIGSVGLRADGQYIVALQTGLYGFDFATGRTGFLVDPEPDLPLNRLNDGRVGPDGAYWVGSHCDEPRQPTAHIYRVGPDLGVDRLDSGLTISNGIAFSPDGLELYYADTPARVIYRRRIDGSGGVSKRQVFHDFSGIRDGRPDGAAMDSDGNYWSALVRGGQIGCFEPSGRLIRTIDLPVRFPTMCAFGGPALETLFVTSTHHLLPAPEVDANPLEGALFRIDGLGARGLAQHIFAG